MSEETAMRAVAEVLKEAYGFFESDETLPSQERDGVTTGLNKVRELLLERGLLPDGQDDTASSLDERLAAALREAEEGRTHDLGDFSRYADG